MRILIIENGYRDLLKSRIPLGEYFKEKGDSVIYACPNPKEDSDIFNLKMSRNRFSFFLLIYGIIKLKKIEKEEKIDAVISFRLTSNILNYFSSFFGVTKNRVAVITGLGYAFIYNGIKYKILKIIITFFYKLAEKRLVIVAQNPDDLKDIGLKRGEVILGSGIKDPKMHTLLKKNENQNLCLLFVGRLLKSKGIDTAVAIFQETRKKNKTAKLFIAGDIDVNNPDSISKKYLSKIKKIEGIVYLNYVDNLQEVYLNCNVLIFPSIYREGVPRTIIEALSYGLTIITLDKPGCREAVYGNGILLKNNFIEEGSKYLTSLSKKDLIDNQYESIKIFNEKFSQKVIFPQYYKKIVNNKVE